MNYVQLSKTISYALRHKPEEFNLVLDSEGYVDIDTLCKAVHCDRQDIYHLVNDIQNKPGEKKRFELMGSGATEMIRACYGHSTDQVKIEYTESIPPAILYHGTPYTNYEKISLEGLKPMGRQYVHMSEDIDTAIRVGDRYAKGTLIAVFVIDTEAARADGIKFYKGNDTTWLTDSLPAQYFKEVQMKMKA